MRVGFSGRPVNEIQGRANCLRAVVRPTSIQVYYYPEFTRTPGKVRVAPLGRPDMSGCPCGYDAYGYSLCRLMLNPPFPRGLIFVADFGYLILVYSDKMSRNKVAHKYECEVSIDFQQRNMSTTSHLISQEIINQSTQNLLYNINYCGAYSQFNI